MGGSVGDLTSILSQILDKLDQIESNTAFIRNDRGSHQKDQSGENQHQSYYEPATQENPPNGDKHETPKDPENSPISGKTEHQESER